MKNTNKNLSFPKFVVGNLPLSRLLLTEEKQPNLIKKVEDPRVLAGRANSGMTTDFMGFTLIELLVVVLIIGILAAVAVPQYQKVVEKSRATQALSLLKTVANAYAAHYQANGEYANSFDELAIDIPWTGNTSCIKNALDVKSNQDWSLQLFKNSSYTSLHVTRINGKYKGAGFVYSFETISAGFLLQQLICYERTNSASFVFDTNLPAGSYCQKLFNGTQIGGAAGRYYTLPY